MTRTRAAAVVTGALLLGAMGFAAHALLHTTVPGGLQPVHIDPAAYFTSAQLRRGRDIGRFLNVLGVLRDVAVIAAFAVYARFGARFERESAAGRIGTGIMLALLGFAIAWLARLPFDIGELWWLRKHHIVHASYPGFVVGNWFRLGAQFLFISLAIVIVMGLAGPLRRLWWLVAAPVFATLALAQAFVSPYLLTDTHSLDDPALATRVAALARADGLGHVRVGVEEVHGATTQPNAEAVGFGPGQRIVLWDTLLDGRFSEAEVTGVIAHELGHLKRRHLLREVGWYGLFAVLIAAAVAAATRRRGGMYAARSVPVALLAYVTLQLAVTPLHNAVTRRYEAEADWISLQTTRNPDAETAMFKRLAVLTQADPDPPGWARALFEDHPSIAQRLAMVEAWRARSRLAPR